MIRPRYPETQADTYCWIGVGIVALVIFGTLLQPGEPTCPKPTQNVYGNENGINAR